LFQVFVKTLHKGGDDDDDDDNNNNNNNNMKVENLYSSVGESK
jgi:hypothetical protein